MVNIQFVWFFDLPIDLGGGKNGNDILESKNMFFDYAAI